MLGAVARCDNGGLATQTVEFVRHMRPEWIVAMDLGDAGRGEFHPERLYEGIAGYEPAIWFVNGTTMTEMAASMLADCDAVYVAEATYGPELAKAGAKMVIQANPELWRPDPENHHAKVILPTMWEHARFPERTPILPVPVALERFEYVQRQDAQTFAFVCGPAMLDRNGYELLMAALPFVASQIDVEIHGGISLSGSGPTRVGNATVRWFPPTAEYWQTLDTNPDVLVMPRRYGGLCLPVQEAAAQGIPAIMLDLEPQSGWLDPECLVPASDPRPTMMKGGQFNVWSCRPEALAQTLDHWATHPGLVQSQSRKAREWAVDRSWDHLKVEYEEMFR